MYGSGVSGSSEGSMSGEDCGRLRSCLICACAFATSRWCMVISRSSFVCSSCACSRSCWFPIPER